MCLTASHRNASFELLENLSLTSVGVATALARSGASIRGAIVLATCNRFEAYFDVAEASTAANDAFAALADASGLDEGSVRAAVRVFDGADAAAHLFAVSSGLESVVVGEDEISGQVRRAFARAREEGTTTSELEQLFQRATTTSRGVRSRTALGGTGRSLLRLSLELASSRIVDWAQTRVLVVGTGQYAAAAVTALRDRGATGLTVFSPSGRAAQFAAKHGLNSAESLRAGIADSDVIIACTTSMVVLATSIPDDRRRLIVDLGLPRNVDPAVAASAGVELLDLETVALHAPLEQLSAADEARAMVTDAAAEFAAEQTAAPAIVALRGHIFELLEAEVERARRRGDDGSAEAALRHFAGVLLHSPSLRAREFAANGDAPSFERAVATVYGLDIAPAARARPGHSETA